MRQEVLESVKELVVQLLKTRTQIRAGLRAYAAKQKNHQLFSLIKSNEKPSALVYSDHPEFVELLEVEREMTDTINFLVK